MPIAHPAQRPNLFANATAQHVLVLVLVKYTRYRMHLEIDVGVAKLHVHIDSLAIVLEQQNLHVDAMSPSQTPERPPTGRPRRSEGDSRSLGLDFSCVHLRQDSDPDYLHAVDPEKLEFQRKKRRKG